MAHLSPKLSPVSGLPVAVLLGLLCLPLVGARPYPGAQTALVIFGTDTIRAGVADDYTERVQGLKGRTSVPDGTGLLFVFEEAAERSFWMIDTLIDLDIAFMDDEFRIIRIATMTAGTSDVTHSMGPARFALEVGAGWFAEKGIRVGTVARVIFDPGRVGAAGGTERGIR